MTNKQTFVTNSYYKRLFENADFVKCLLTVCFSAEISPGQGISNSTTAVRSVGVICKSQPEIFPRQMGLTTTAIIEALFFGLESVPLSIKSSVFEVVVQFIRFLLV